ncbi:MAG: LytR/AlgR family response regulator transcription factor [Chitinophagales bacterium]
MFTNQRFEIPKVIVLQTSLKIYRLHSKDLLYFEAANKEILLNWSGTDRTPLTLSISIGKCEKVLAPYGFFRIHRPYLINREQIFYFNFTENYVTLYGGKTIPVARNRRKLLAEWILKEREFFD